MIWYRCRLGADWRPAYISSEGVAYVSPRAFQPWREATTSERGSFQRRIPQGTVGRIFDDSLYEIGVH